MMAKPPPEWYLFRRPEHLIANAQAFLSLTNQHHWMAALSGDDNRSALRLHPADMKTLLQIHQDHQRAVLEFLLQARYERNPNAADEFPEDGHEQAAGTVLSLLDRLKQKDRDSGSET